VNRRRVKSLSKEELSELTTPRLLAYRKKLLALEASAELSDSDESELAALDPGYVYFKETAEWADLHTALTILLKDRKHIA
jgi:hypothetical protein